MAWWRRARPKNTSSSANAATSTADHVLVISDIHLGEDILVRGPGHLAEYIRSLNLNLTQFIEHHRTHPPAPGKLWHLVVNGDMFDFVKVSLRPEEGDLSDAVGRAEQIHRETQLPNTPHNVVWKLSRILEIHRPLFREMGRFLAAGNSVTIIEGNHDAEFYFPEVRESLRQEIVRLSEVREPAAAAALAQRMQFRSWFVASPGRYHIEHGHQYDEFCSFEYNLAPDGGTLDQTLATPLSHRPLPYFAELLGDFSTHGVTSWSFARIVRFIGSLGPQAALKLLRLYLVVGFALLKQAGKKRRAQLLGQQEAHQAQLRQLSLESPYGFAVLTALDRLKAPPAEYSLFKMMHVFYVDRLLVASGTLVSVLCCWLVFGRGALFCSLLGLLLMVGLSRWPHPKIRMVLRRSAAQIADVSGARFVVFGHSHAPEVVNLRQEFGVGRFGETSFYLNSGSWVTREILLGEAGEGMTYVEMTLHGAALKRWLGPDVPPKVMQST